MIRFSLLSFLLSLSLFSNATPPLKDSLVVKNYVFEETKDNYRDKMYTAKLHFYLPSNGKIQSLTLVPPIAPGDIVLSANVSNITTVPKTTHEYYLYIGFTINTDITEEFNFKLEAKNSSGIVLNDSINFTIKIKPKAEEKSQFYQKDFLINGDAYSIKAFEKKKKEFDRFEFELISKSSEEKEVFSMNDISPDVKTILLFKTLLGSAFSNSKAEEATDVGAISERIKTYAESIAPSGISPNPSTTNGILLDIDTIIDAISKNKLQGISSAEKLLEPFTKSLSDSGHVDEAIDLKARAIAADMADEKLEEEEETDLFGTASQLLFDAYIAYTSIEALRGSKAGELTANSIVPIYNKANTRKNKKNNRAARKELESGSDRRADRRSKRKFYKENKFVNNSELVVKSIKVEFQDEQITGLKITGKIATNDNDSLDIEFENTIPYPFSRKKDVGFNHRFRNKIYYKIRNKKSFEDHVIANTKMENKSFIYLDEVLKNDYYLIEQTENYSPKDTIITIVPNTEPITVFKPSSVKLVKVKVYSDFIGLGETNPNGLVQTEITRRIFLNPNSRRLPWKKRGNFYIGMLNSFRPKVAFTKLESNKKSLAIDTLWRSSDTLQLYTQPINLLRRTKRHFGLEGNLLYAGFPNYHMKVFLNFGIDLRQVDIKVPTYDESSTFITNTSKAASDISPYLNLDENRVFTLNTIWLYPEVAFEFRPDSDFKLALTIKSLSAPYQSKVIGIHNADYNRKLLRPDILNFKFEVSGRFKAFNNNSKFFFRTYYNLSINDNHRDFFQMQIGYSRDILTNLKNK